MAGPHAVPRKAWLISSAEPSTVVLAIHGLRRRVTAGAFQPLVNGPHLLRIDIAGAPSFRTDDLEKPDLFAHDGLPWAVDESNAKAKLRPPFGCCCSR